MNENKNQYIGYITNKNTVLFKVNDITYEKKIKERNKIRTKEYFPSESVNITCNNLNDKYVYIDSDNRTYINKNAIILCISIFLLGIISCIITFILKNELIKPILTGTIILYIILFITFFIYFIYNILYQNKKLYKNYTSLIEGEIINYCRKERRHDKDETEHCIHGIMYKYKLPNGTIIHSVLYSYPAKMLYKNYPINKKVLIRYNPHKCTESCLVDEYENVINGKKLPRHASFVIMTVGTITNITTKLIDAEVEDYLKEECLVDYIECEYQIDNNNYRNISIYGVKHNRFTIGQKIRIFYEHNNHNNFYCDVEKRISNLDKY